MRKKIKEKRRVFFFCCTEICPHISSRFKGYDLIQILIYYFFNSFCFIIKIMLYAYLYNKFLLYLNHFFTANSIFFPTLHSIILQFWWGSSGKNKKITWVYWEKIYRLNWVFAIWSFPTDLLLQKKCGDFFKMTILLVLKFSRANISQTLLCLMPRIRMDHLTFRQAFFRIVIY